MVDEMKLRRITFYGYQNPNNYYKRSKVFLMTSVAEGLPLTIVEAQQLGVVPVVLETFSGVHDLISDGVNGRIVKSERYFQKCLMDTMMNSDKREMMAYNGMESCKKFYAPYIVDQWEKLFDNL
jgi:glycosyltransferase involved in cell wall biosynthesis